MNLKDQKGTITCKAAICWEPDKPLTVEEIQVEPPSVSEVRVKMLCASICHSDIIALQGFPLALYPRVVGHEGFGVIESVGEGVEGLKEGDTIIPAVIGECKECPNCKTGKTNMCYKFPLNFTGLMLDQTTRMSIKGQKIYHMFTCSTFSEYTVLNSNLVVKVNQAIDPWHASFLSCGFSTGFGAVWKEAKIEQGSSVAIFGLGGVGVGAVAGARSLKAGRIIGIDLNEYKKSKAEFFGLTDFINPNKLNGKSIADKVREMTDGLGVDYSFECTGVESLLNEALDATKTGSGVTVFTGAVVQKHVPILYWTLMAGKTIKGCLMGGVRPHSDLPQLCTKCINKEFDLDGMLTHQVDLNEINHAFELLKQPECLKVVVNMG
ncbi:S-(hydroxymethyl)glutathione dehydrogenase / alcohol dehydrogenase protein [Dioscorea alata]|uniref:S-(Hydroxymethyl)glutathione dehydrogenase / alcohol dehydrogenase protein n=1 Tax=Dioscorea alata TaxID=55571 RepID=A0ACB7WHY3_DIOAL|nr:S-(hydroxymethyl)glutathione dehydrogenase / alcohol dehydrogenase protein [Dioscorea alata]